MTVLKLETTNYSLSIAYISAFTSMVLNGWFIRDHGNWKVSSSIWGHAAQTSLRKERHGLESDEPERIFLMMSKIQKAVAEQYMKIQWRLIQLFIVTKKGKKRKEKKRKWRLVYGIAKAN